MKFLEQQASRSVCVCVCPVVVVLVVVVLCAKRLWRKKGKKMCCVRACTFEILHHLSLSLICFLQCSSIQPGTRITEHPTLPTHQKLKPKNQKKLHKQKTTLQTNPKQIHFPLLQAHPVPRDFSKEMLKRDVIYDIKIYLSIAPFCLFSFCVLLFSQFSQFSLFFLFFFSLSLSLSLVCVLLPM